MDQGQQASLDHNNSIDRIDQGKFAYDQQKSYMTLPYGEFVVFVRKPNTEMDQASFVLFVSKVDTCDSWELYQLKLQNGSHIIAGMIRGM